MNDSHHPLDGNSSRLTRRGLLRGMAGAAALGVAWPLTSSSSAAALKGRIKQSVCQWCYGGYMKKADVSLDQFAAAVAKMGLKSIELVGQGQWPTLKKWLFRRICG